MHHTALTLLALALGTHAAPKPIAQGYYPLPTNSPYYTPAPSGGYIPTSDGAPFPVIPTGSMTILPFPVPSAPASGGLYPRQANCSGMPAVGPTGSMTILPVPSASAPASAGIYPRQYNFSMSATNPDSSSSASDAEVTEAPSTGTSAVGDSSGGGLPASAGSSALAAVQTIASGDSFDGGMVAYDRGVSCTGQAEGGDSDAVFMIENGGSLSNVIIGPNQIEGVHCQGACTLTNVWWSAVCEDAFSIKEQADGETTTITGGGAFGAEDKVIQHNGGGTVSVSGFTVDNFGKLYRSCGNCDDMPQRHVIMNDITATEGSELAGINSNYGDTATFSNIKVSGVDEICVTYTGNDSGDEPEENGSGPSESCIYTETDITET